MNFKYLIVFLFFAFSILHFAFLIPPAFAQESCIFDRCNNGTDCSYCVHVTTCGNISFHTCEDNLRQTNTAGNLCQNGATDFRCYSSCNSSCNSSSAGSFTFSCSSCSVTSPPTPTPPSGRGGGGTTITIARPQAGYADIGLFITNILKILFIIAIIVVLFMLVWGAYEWMTSGGDKESIGKARGRIIAALIGLAVLAVAFAIAVVAAQFVGFQGLNIIVIPTP